MGSPKILWIFGEDEQHVDHSVSRCNRDREVSTSCEEVRRVVSTGSDRIVGLPSVLPKVLGFTDIVGFSIGITP